MDREMVEMHSTELDLLSSIAKQGYEHEQSLLTRGKCAVTSNELYPTDWMLPKLL